MASIGLALNKDSTYAHIALNQHVVVLEGDIDPVSVQIGDDEPTIVVNFATSADGRGFSLARHLRNRLHFQGELIATGNLIPDQVNAAFACGFDAIWVPEERQIQYGLQHWINAGVGQDNIQYWASRGGKRQAWAERLL